MQTHYESYRSFKHSNSLGKRLRLAILAGASAALMAGTAFAANPTSWEVASEFNDQTNNCSPSTVWCYGVETGLGTAFITDSDQYSQNPPYELGWGDLSRDGFSASRIYHNVEPYIITDPDGSTTIPAHALIMHPGANCEYATIQFTVPYKGRYKLSGQFYGIYDQSVTTTTDVYILVNNNGVTPLWSGNVNVAGGARFASFTSRTTPLLQAGDTIEFEVGCGGNGWTDDWTGLNAVIEKRK